MRKNPFHNFKNPFKDLKNPFPHLRGRKLYRSPREALVFGICAGLANYLQVDSVFVRLAVLAFAYLTQGWPVLVLYVVAAFVIPIDPAQDSVASHQAPKDVTGKMDENQNM